MASPGSTLLDGLCPTDDPRAFENTLRAASQDDKDPMYNELWHACAGPHVNLPTIGEKVFYFPQGHLEQVKANRNQESSSNFPIYSLPYEIPCIVICVKLKVGVETDKVYAEVTLLPEVDQDNNDLLPNGTILPSMPQRTNAWFFSKVLTNSDTSNDGGFSMRRLRAEECFPPMDSTQNPPEQELVAKDLHGEEWRFRHIYRGDPREHLLTSGWKEFIRAKKIQPGDHFILLRSENGECRVGVRRSKKSRSSSMSILTSHTMQFGILATAHHALLTGSLFTVDYRPRSSPSEFIIPYAQYMMSIRRNIVVGGVFRLKNHDDEFPPESFTGTIVGIEEIDPVRWPGSIWRCLKMRWHGPWAIVLERKISPWEVVPLAITHKLSLRKIFRNPRSVNPGVMSLQIFMESMALSRRGFEVFPSPFVQRPHNQCMLFGVDLNKTSRNNIISVQQRNFSAQSHIEVHKSVFIGR